MKSNSRSVEDILRKVAAVICAPFFIIFLILFAISSSLLFLVFVIFTKLGKDVKFPHFFDFLFDDLYYESYEKQSEEFKEAEELDEFEDCNY